MNTEIQCRICLEDIKLNESYSSPCRCTGTLSFVHNRCLNIWIEELRIQERPLKCEICNHYYSFESNYLRNDHHHDLYPLRNDHHHNLYRVQNDHHHSLYRFIIDCFNFNQANPKMLYLFIATILMYIFAYLFLSGPLSITVHEGELPNMDILFGSDSYVKICVDHDCWCQTEIQSNNNKPKWNYRCTYWNDESVFLFSNINFLIYDSDYYFDDLIGTVTINILWHYLNLFAGNPVMLRWKTPYIGSIYVTIQWKANFKALFNT